jgi:uncharacterized membrane protein
LTSTWQLWAVLSAIFAALTAVFAKVGVENVNADFATFIRTIVILVTLAFILLATGQFQSPGAISSRTYVFLMLSGLATGASWICFPRAEDRRCRQGRAHRQAFRRFGGAVRSSVSRRAPDGTELAGCGPYRCRCNSSRLSLIERFLDCQEIAPRKSFL